MTSNDWLTPPHILDVVRRLGPIDLDPCILGWDPAVHPDGLVRPWVNDPAVSDRGVVFVNPPYGRGLVEKWVDKAIREAAVPLERNTNRSIVLLLPARTEQPWFQSLAWLRVHSALPQGNSAALCFIRGRVRFINPDTGAAVGAGTFPSVLWYLGTRAHDFREAVRWQSADRTGLGVVL